MEQKKKRNIPEKIIFLIMVLQAIAAGGLYLYRKMEKWYLEESLTVFLYPVIVFLIGFILLCSLAFSFVYFIKKITTAKKIYFVVPLLITIGFVVYANVNFNEMKLRENNFEQYRTEREQIVELIVQGELVPDETGEIVLPKHLQTDEMARNGSVYIVDCKEGKGIYFCTFSGILESSAGFVYIPDDFESEVSINNTITLQKQYDDGWYYCGTG